MRALRCDPGASPRVALRRDVPEPACAPGEAIIRPLRIGIASTDVAMAQGRAAASPDGGPITLGHEFVGVVESIVGTTASNGAPSRARTATLVGKRIVGSIDVVCGACDLCKGGLSKHCRARTVLGVRGRDGCLADRFALPVANLLEVPKEIDDDHAVFAEPLAAAIHAAQQVRVEGTPYITVLGDGRFGLLCAQVMNRLNARVRVLGRHENRMALCDKWGIKRRHEGEAGRRADQDVVVDCTGSPEGFALAMQLVRPRGTILLKSMLAWGVPGEVGGSAPEKVSTGARGGADLSPIVANEITVVGSRSGSVGEALDVLRRREVDVTSLITRRCRLDDGLEALALAARPEQIKVIVDP